MFLFFLFSYLFWGFLSLLDTMYSDVFSFFLKMKGSLLASDFHKK